MEPARRSGDFAEQITRRASRIRRALTKYFFYPARVRQMRETRAVHILDHSYAHLLGALRPGIRSMVTVHDLVPILDPRGLTRGQIDRWRKGVAQLHLADLVVAISEPVASALQSQLSIPSERIRLINMAVDVEKFSQPLPVRPVHARLPKIRILMRRGWRKATSDMCASRRRTFRLATF